MPRLTPEQLARFRADYHECRLTIMPLVLECEALVRERDEARAEAARFAAQSRAMALARPAPAPHADALRLRADAALAAGERSVTAEVDALARVVDDLRASRREAAGLAAELARLRDAVREFLAADGHDLCHENRRELAAAAGLEPGEPGLPPEAEFALRCVEYRQELYGHDGPGSEAEAWQAEVARLQRDLDAAVEVMAGGETPPKLAAVLRACSVQAIADVSAEVDALTVERDRLAAACREALGRLEGTDDEPDLEAALRLLRDALAAEGGG